MGYSRESFYRFKELEKNGEQGLQEISRRKPILKNRVEESIEREIVNFAIEKPVFGQQKVANKLRKKGISISAGGVRSIWLKHDFDVLPKI